MVLVINLNRNTMSEKRKNYPNPIRIHYSAKKFDITRIIDSVLKIYIYVASIHEYFIS